MPTEQARAIEAISLAQGNIGAFLQQHNIEFKEIEVDIEKLIPSYALDTTPLADTEQKELLSSMKAFGIITRVVINEKFEILDGGNRVSYAQQLGWKKVRVVMLINTTPGLEIFIAYQLNYARRHANTETRHKAYNAFKNRLLNLTEGKTREESIAILPEIEQFWPEVKQAKRGPKKSEVIKTGEIISGIPSGTLRKWSSIDQTKEEMNTALPEQYPTIAGITDSQALRFLAKKKKVKPGFSLVDSATCLCLECDKKFTCTILKAIATRSCYADTNQAICKNLKPLDKESVSEKIFLQPSFALAEYYRSVKRIPVKDKAWRKIMLGRNIKTCRDILELCDFSLDTAKFVVSYLGNQFDRKGFSWSLETIVKNIDEGIMACKKENV